MLKDFLITDIWSLSNNTLKVVKRKGDSGEIYLLSEGIVSFIQNSNPNSLYFILEKHLDDFKYDLKCIYNADNAKIYPVYLEEDQMMYRVWQSKIFEETKQDFIKFLFGKFVKNGGMYL